MLMGFCSPHDYMFFALNNMNAPSVSYTFRLKDVHMFYCEHDDTMNFVDESDESRLEVAGITSDDMFCCIGNALVAGDNILGYVTGKPWQVKRAQEMIDKLQTFIDKHSVKENN